MSDRVWYASYGSNMQLARFMCYIAGGQAMGSATLHGGCSDSTPPLAIGNIAIDRELYFARQSRSWSHGGVAFLSDLCGSGRPTLGRMYLITEHQLADIIRQECQIDGALPVDFRSAIREGSQIVREHAWYGKLICLGVHGGSPIFTFTTADEDPARLNLPSIPYLRTIAGGLREAYGYGTEASAGYLAGKAGIRGVWSPGELMERL